MIGSSLKKVWSKVLRPYTIKLLIVSCFIVACLTLVAFSTHTPSFDVNVKLNGHELQVTTQAKTVQELLQELNIAYTYQDEIIPELDAELESDLNITWNQAKYISVIRFGKHEPVWTTAQTVGEFIKEQGITLGNDIEVSPALSTALYSNQWVEIAEVYEKTEEEQFSVPYQTVRRDDPTMLQGQEKKVVEGKEGIGVNKYQVSYKNGFEVDRKKVSTNVVEEKQDEIIAVGTIASVSRGGYVFAPRTILENVTLTAYSAGVSHTGKSPDHPQYGITSSGARAEEGRTIAVDPDVIPIGTWVYIEDIGLRKAEDTGGAVKGNKIDIYYETDSSAQSFGTKKNYKVYVIGKNKPAIQE